MALEPQKGPFGHHIIQVSTCSIAEAYMNPY